MWAVARFIRRERIQIIHGHHGNDLWPTILAARLSGLRPKVVLTRHMAKSPSSWFSRRFLLSGCDALVAVSGFVAKILTEGMEEPGATQAERRSRPPILGNHEKIRAIYGGIDTERFRPLPVETPAVERLRREWGLASNHFAFAVVGGYDLPRGKGQVEFLEAAARVHASLENARFLIVGRGNMKEHLEGMIQKLGLEGKAWLTPYCQDMPVAMNAIDCLVHPQVGTEALGLVVCEAHACGKPVIASDLDGIPEAFLIGNYGRLVRPGNVDDLTAAFEHWAAHSSLRMEERMELHQRVQRKFSLETLGRNMLALYRQLLDRPLAPLP
jgi:glycosyltransferase involved in cell wall biosynthesis